MAGAPAPSGIPGTPLDYGNPDRNGVNTAYNSLSAPITQSNFQGLFNGLGPAQLSNAANYQLQTYTPQYNITPGVASPGNAFPGANVTGSNGQSVATNVRDLSQYQNSNVAGYDATQKANAQNAGFLQQAAIAQNRLLGQLNGRGLLNSFEKGGAGTADFQQLNNALGNAANDQGQALQGELSGLNANDMAYQMAMANYNNEMNSFNNYKNQNQPGLTDVMGLGGSALGLLTGI